MSNNKGFWFFRMVLLGLLFITLVITVFMSLWNWLMPMIFGLPALTFLQAGGLLILSKFIFGFGGGGKGGWKGSPKHHNKGHWRHKMREKWHNMNAEERTDYKNKMKEKWGNWGKDDWCDVPEKD